MKYLVRQDAVGADGDDVRPAVEKVLINVGNCRKLGWSDKAEIRGVEQQQQPLIIVVVQANLRFGPGSISLGAKIRCSVSQHDSSPFTSKPMISFPSTRIIYLTVGQAGEDQQCEKTDQASDHFDQSLAHLNPHIVSLSTLLVRSVAVVRGIVLAAAVALLQRLHRRLRHQKVGAGFAADGSALSLHV